MVVTLTSAANTGSSTIHIQATTGAIAANATNSANPGDTQLYVQPLSAGLAAAIGEQPSMQAAIASGTLTNAANPGATSFVVNDIGTSNILVGTVAAVDNHGNPLFMLGAETTVSPIGFTEVNASGVATLNESLLGSPALVLPGVITSYKNNGVVGSAPLPSLIKAQYVDGALGGPSDPNFTASAVSAASRQFISADNTTTAVTANPRPGQVGVTETLSATVSDTSPADLLPPIGTVTFTDTFTEGGVTTTNTLGTVTLPSMQAITGLTNHSTGPVGATLSNPATGAVFATTGTALPAGDWVTIVGATPNTYDGTYLDAGPAGPPNTILLEGPITGAVHGLAAGSGGLVDSTAVATVASTAGLANLDIFYITGAKNSGYNAAGVPIAVTSATTFTYPVAPGLPSPDGGTSITGFQLLAGSDTVTITDANFAGGNPAVFHTITATYNGDNTAPFPLPTSFPFRGQWLTSKATTTFGVGQDVTTGTLSANPTQTITTTATANTGALTLSVNAIPAPIPSGATLTFGSTTVTLSHAAVQGATTLQVNATSATIDSGATAPYPTAAFGSAVTFIDTLTSGTGSQPHGGTVVFKDGTTVLGTTSVNIRGTANLVVSSLAVQGEAGHSVTATFNGNGNFERSTSNTLIYTITPGASTTTITGPNLPAAATFSVSSLTSTSTMVSAGLFVTTATATVTGGTLTGLSDLGMTIAGATPAGYNGFFDITITSATTFTYQFTGTSAATSPATGTITATETLSNTNGAETEIGAAPVVGTAFNLRASVVGQPGFTPSGTVVFVAESNHRDAVAGSAPSFVPFTIGTATLSGTGLAVLSVPATGAGSIATLAAAHNDGDGADIYELEAFYSGDANYAKGNSTAIGRTRVRWPLEPVSWPSGTRRRASTTPEILPLLRSLRPEPAVE